MQGNEIRYNPAIVDDPPYTTARAVARFYEAPLIFEDGDGFEMVAFEVRINGGRPYPVGVMALDAWDKHGQDVYDVDQDEHDPERIPTPGTVSHGTMRLEDLIPKFMFLLERLNPNMAAVLTSDYSGQGWPYSQAGLSFGDPFEPPQTELAVWLLEDLFTSLNHSAPPGYTFGANEGDGSDYGFWQIEEYFLQDTDEGPYLNDPYAGAAYELGEQFDLKLLDWEDWSREWVEERVKQNTSVITDENDPDYDDDAYCEAVMEVSNAVLDRVLENWGWTRLDEQEAEIIREYRESQDEHD
jgi:hypothetical protein